MEPENISPRLEPLHLFSSAGTVTELGLYDLNRKIMPVGEAYRELIRNWKDIVNEESFGLVFQNW